MGINRESNLLLTTLLLPFILILLSLVVYSIYFLCTNTTKRVWLLILTLTTVTSLSLMLPDLIFGGQRSTENRYLIPCYLGIQLAIAYLLSTKVSHISVRTTHQWRWKAAITTLLSIGLISCIISSQAYSWWNKGIGSNKYNSLVADIVNHSDHPLVVSDGNAFTSMSLTGSIFSLSYFLENKVQLQLTLEPNVPKISDKFSDLFLYKPSNSLRKELEKNIE